MSDTDIKRKANEISEKYIDAFSLFEKCHKIYDSNRLLSDEDIQLKVNQLPLELKFNSIQIASKHSDSLYLYHKQGSVSE